MNTNRRLRLLGVAIVACATLACAGNAAEVTLHQAVDIGGGGLLAIQNANGSWGSGRTPLYRDSSMALEALRALGLEGEGAYSSGGSYLDGLSGSDYDLLARKLLGKIDSGSSLSTLQDTLSDGRESLSARLDGNVYAAAAWPYESDTTDNIFDTAIVYRALLESQYSFTDNGHLAIQVYLRSKQLSDGGWNYAGNDTGNVYVTAVVMLALAEAPNLNASLHTNALNLGRDFLVSQQNISGFWGEAPGTISETALAGLAIQKASERLGNDSTRTEIDAAKDWLRDQQLFEGTWQHQGQATVDFLADGEAYDSAVSVRFLESQAALTSEPEPTPEPTPAPIPSSGPVAEGVTYLKTAQQANGSWAGTPAAEVVTGRVMEGLAALGLDGESEFAAGAGYLSTVTTTTPAGIAWQIIGLAQAGAVPTALLNNLTSLQKADGSWGQGNSSTPTASYETALALRAFRAAGMQANSELDALKVLLRRQQAGGGFGADGSAFSDIEVTGQVLQLLQEVSGTYIVSPFINDILDAIKTAQNGDGGWGDGGTSNAFDSAYALGLLVAAGDLPDDPSGAVNYLLSGQGANGSWSDDAEATIYALQALQSTQPDLIVVAGSVGFSNDEPSAGDVVEVTAEVRNAGLLVSGDFQVQFYNGDPAFGGTGIGDPIDVSSLAPGESTTVSVQWNTSSAGGSTNVYCVADSGDAVAELNESNNAAFGTAFVLSETDLVITAADITFDPSSPVEGDDVSMRVRIRNQGRDAENVFVHILEGTRLITGGAFPFIAERQQVIFTIPLRGLPQGKHDFRVVIDPDNLIAEANEDNNEAIGSIRVSAKRDLYIAQEDIAFVPGNPLEGDQVTVSAVVHNEGDEASENVVVQFFKGNPETGGTQLGNSQTLTSVPANGSASTQVRFDTTGLSGAFDIYVLVDATNIIPESDENNNAASKSISIARNIDLTVADSSILFSNDRPEDGDTITITATAKNAGVVPVSNVKVQFYDGPPSTLVPSWPLQTTGSILSSPIFADIDNDRRLEIVVGSLDSKLYLLRADGTNYSGWPQELEGQILGSPAIGDIDADAEPEIVIGAEDGKIYAFNLDGSAVTGFPYPTADEIVSSPCLADMDLDGALDVVIGSRSGSLFVVNGQGESLPGFPVSADSWIDSSPAVGDIDGDGFPEIVVGSHDQKVYAWNDNGIAVIGFPFETGGFVSSSPALGDIDGDGVLEAVVGSDDGSVYAFNGDGTAVAGWPKTTGSFVRSSPAIVDLDGDSSLDVVVGSFDQRLYAWNGDGSAMTGFPRLVGTELEASPVVADIDGDSLAEVVLAGRDGKVYAFNSDGTEVSGAGFPFVTTDDIRSTPMLADIDADGAMEIVVGSDDGKVYSFDLPEGSYNPLNIQWPMFGHNVRHTAIAGPFSEKAGSAGRPIGDPIVISDLDGGESQSVNVQWDTTGGLGEHAIYVQVDPDNAVTETDETNNLAQQEIYVLIPNTADFIVQQSDIQFSPSQIEPGDTLKVSLKVRNVGTLDASNVLVRLLDGSPAAADSEVLTEFRQSILAGDTLELEYDWITDATDEGGHIVFVLVDPDNEVSEFNEFDNITSRFFYIGNRPPWLNWVNATTREFETPNYSYCGVEPEMGFVDTEFVYQIKYSDPDNNPPGEGYPRVYIDINGDNDTVDETPDFREGSFLMTETDPSDTDYTNGKIYEYRTKLPLGNLARYRFEAYDNGDQPANGEPRVMYQNMGPAVVKNALRVNSMPDYMTWVGRSDPERDTNQITLYGNVHYVGDADSGFYIWDFGDGSAPDVGLIEDPYYISVDHVYENIGTYNASLTVIDEFGNSDTDFVEIKVLPDSTRVRRRALVLDALGFLYTRQNKDWGYFQGPSNNRTATTGICLLAYSDHDFLQIDDFDDSIFAEYLWQGYRFLYTRASAFTASNFDPISRGYEGTFPIFDRNSNNRGYYWAQNSTYYESGMALMGFTGDRESRLYIEFVQDVVDFFLAAQGSGGGWRYSFRADIDNSAAQWPTLGIYGAMQCPFFADVPEWVWAANHPDDPFGTGLLSWLDVSQYKAPGDNQGGFGYSGAGYSYTVTPAGLIMFYAAGLTPNDLNNAYSFDVSNLAAGTYYLYAKITDGVNDPIYTYMPDPIEVVDHTPTITVMDPDSRTGGTPADDVFYVTWVDEDIGDDADISLYYDDDTDWDNGTLGTIVTGLSEDSLNDYYRWDTSGIPQGSYRVWAQIDNIYGKQSRDYSDGVVVIEHDSRPVVQVLAPLADQEIVDDTYTIQWIADDLYSATGSVSIWYDTNNSGFNGVAIVEDLPIQRGVVQSYVWDTTLIPEDEYWIYVTVDDGFNSSVSDYGQGSVVVNHAPVISFTQPDELQEAPNSSSRNYRIYWSGGDPGGAALDLYYDTDNSGFDGTAIALDVNINVSGRYYDWYTGNVPQGEYYIYGIADDGVHAPVVEYASGSISVPNFNPKISVIEPHDTGFVADSYFYFTWTDEAPNADAAVSLLLDPDTNHTNGNEITLVQGISEDDETDAALVDISSVTAGTYYAVAAINQTATPENAVYAHSNRNFTVQHDNAPHLMFIDPARDVIDYATEADFIVPIRFIASDVNDSATVELYYDTDSRNYNGAPIVSATTALSENEGSVSTYLWDTSNLPSDDYYIYAIVYGATETARDYAKGRIRVNQPPSIMVLTPDIGEASQEATFRITWDDADDGDNASIALYYDTDASGQDGELIVSGLSENSEGSGDRYDWDLSRIPAGDYYVYAVIDDGVNAPKIDYSTGTIEVQQHIPRATVLEPNTTYGEITVDNRYTVSWTDWDIDSNATIDFYLDDNTSAGGEIVLATGTVMEDDPLDYYTLDLSGVPEGDYYIYIWMSDDNRTTVYKYRSSRRIYVRHAGAPSILADDSAFAGVVTEDEVELRWMGEDYDSDAKINLYLSVNSNYRTDYTIALDLPETGSSVASQVISVTPFTSREYWLVAEISDGLNPSVYNISNQSFRVNKAPTMAFTSPVDMNTEPDSLTGDRDAFTIRWTATDTDDQARIALYYDTDNSGFDGTLIVSGLYEGSDVSYVWDTSEVPSGSYYIYGVITDPYHDPVQVYSSGTFQVDSDHKPQMTLYSPYSGQDTWDQVFVIQWTDMDYDSDAQISFYIEDATPGYDGVEELIVGGISEDSPDDFYAWDISSATNSTIDIIGVIRDASWEVVATAPRPLNILHSTDLDLVPTIDFVDPGNELLPDNIRVNNNRVRGVITSSTESYTVRFVAFDLETPDTTTIDLYYDTNNSGPNGQLIAADVAIQNNGGVTSYDWDLSEVAGGTYYFYAVIFDGVNDPRTVYSHSVLHINRKPTIELTPPEPPFDMADLEYLIQWETSDPDSNASITLYWDTDNSGFDGTEIVAGLNENDGGGPAATLKWLEDRYGANLASGDPLARNSFPWYQDSYYTYGLVKGLRLNQILEFGGADWDAEMVDFFAEDEIHLADGSFKMIQGSGSHFDGSGDNYLTMPTAVATLCMTEAVLGTLPVGDAGDDKRVPPGQLVAFDASASYHPNKRREIILYEWDFDGDGVFDFESEEPYADHTFEQVGLYPVTLRVSDNDFCGALTDDDIVLVTVTDGNLPPVAKFTANPSPGLVGFEVTFDGTTSDDPNGDTISKYEWDLNGNGQFNDAEGAVVTWIYNREQIVNVGLRVTDDDLTEPLTGFVRMDLDIVQADLKIMAQGDAPDPFSPGASVGRKDTNVISYSLNKRANPMIQLWNSSDSPVRLLGPESRSAGGNTYSWNGQDDSAQVLPSDLYTYKIGDQGATLYRQLGWRREDGTRLSSAADPDIRRLQDFSLEMLYTASATDSIQIRSAASGDGLNWTSGGVIIPEGLAGSEDSAGAMQPDLVLLTETAQESWAAGMGVDYASGESVDPVAGGIQIAGFSGNLALDAQIVDSSSTPPEYYYGTGSLASLIDGVNPSDTNGRDGGWVSYNNKSATAVVEFDEPKLIEKIRVYFKTDSSESNPSYWVYYPEEVTLYSTADADINFVTQAVKDLRGWEEGDTARWAEFEFPGGLAARRIAVKMRSASGQWMSIGEIEVLQDGYNATGYLISNVFDLGSEGLLSVQWEATRPNNTSLNLQIRSGDTPEPDGSWTAFTAVGQQTIVDTSLHARYVQYRADLRTGLANNYNVTPLLTRVRFNNLHRIYYSGDDGSTNRILSAVSLDGTSYTAEAGVRVEPAGPYATNGVEDPVYLPGSGEVVLEDFSSIQSDASDVLIDATGIFLQTVFDSNVAASGEGTTVLWDNDRYSDSYVATNGIEGDGGANRNSRWAGADAAGPPWTIDFDLGQERTLEGVRMLRHDSNYEVTGFEVYGATVYNTTGEDDFTGFSLIYDSPVYTAGTDHEGIFTAPVTARYIRLSMTNWANSHPEFSEFELYESVHYATEGVYVTGMTRVGGQGVKNVDLDATIPGGCSVKVEVMTGPTLLSTDQWSEFVEVTPGLALRLPQLEGEYAIFRLTLISDGEDTPVVRAVHVNNRVRLYLTGTSGGTTRILSADSDDGINWNLSSDPIVDVGGIEAFENVASPDVRKLLDGTWVMFFRGMKNGDWGIYRATSSNGVAWTIDEDAILETEPGETGFGSTQYLPLLDGTDRLYFTSQTGSNTRILSAAAAPEGQIEVDNIPPDVSIAFPQADAILTGPFQITGTATDRNYLDTSDNFVSYKFDLSGDGGQSWNTLTTVINPVVNGVLSVLNTQAFADGDYLLRLTAEDIAGNISETQVAVVFENGAPPRPIITSPTVHGVPVTVARSPITVEGFSAANTRVEGFLTTEDGTRSSIGTVETTGGNVIPQTYSDSDYSDGIGVAFDDSSDGVSVDIDGNITLAIDQTAGNILTASAEATASSELSGSYSPDRAIDNNGGTYWASARNASSAWLNLHWEDARVMGGISITLRSNGSSTDYTLQALIDGSYQDLLTTTQTSGTVFFMLGGLETTDLRIYTDTITAQDIKIYEIDVYGLRYRGQNIASEANGGQLISFTGERNTTSWAAANILRGQGNYWSTPNLSGATDPYEFIIELNTFGEDTVPIDRIVIYNYGNGNNVYASEDFEFAVSVTDASPESFVRLFPETLEQRTGSQEFTFPSTEAKYAKLTILSGLNTSYWELDEIEVYRAGSVGTLVSTLKGTGAIDNFNQLEFFARNSAETNVRVEVRSGNVDPPDDTLYSPWTEVQNGDVIPDSLNARYIQYRAFLESSDSTLAPIIEEVRISIVGEYGSWAIPNVDILGGTNTITAVAIDMGDDSVSEEALPIDVSLDVVDVEVNRDKAAYNINQDVNITLDVTSPPAQPGQGSGDRVFTAYLRVQDDLGFIVNADGGGTPNHEILWAPFWVDETIPADATYSANFTWTSDQSYRSASAHTSDGTAGVQEHFFKDTSNPLEVLEDSKLVQFVYLDPDNTPTEIMLELVTDGTSEHRIFWGPGLIDRGVLGTPSRVNGGDLPPAGEWVRLDIDLAAVDIEDASLTGMSFVTLDGRAYWNRTTLGVRQFDFPLAVAESDSFSFVWDTADNSDGDYTVESYLSLGEIEKAAQDTSPVFEILPDLNVLASITTDKAEYERDELVRLSYSVESLSANHLYKDLTLQITVPRIDGSTEPLFSKSVSVALLEPGQDLRLSDKFNVGDSEAGTYTATLQVLDGSPATVIASDTANFDILLEQPGVAGVIQAAPRVFRPGEDVDLRYRIQNTGNGTLSDDFRLRIVDPEGGEPLPPIDLGRLTLARAEIITGTRTINTAGFIAGTYTAYLEGGGGAWVIDFDIAQAQPSFIAPFVDLVAIPYEGPGPLTVSLVGSATDSDGLLAEYGWDFEVDGAVLLDATASVSSATIEVATTYTYAAPGFYTTVFQAKDDQDLIGAATAEIIVWTPTATPTSTATSTPTPTDTPTPTNTPTPTATSPGGDLYALDGYGAIYLVGNPTPVVERSMTEDLAEAFEITSTNRGFVILDAMGTLHPIGDASGEMTGVNFDIDITRDLELMPGDDGAIVLDGFGTIHPFGNVPEHFGSVYFGTIWRPFDAGEDVEMVYDSVGDVTGWYVLDALGGIHALGAAPWYQDVNFGFDIARDLELLPDGSGYLLLDGFGLVHGFGAGEAIAKALLPGGTAPGKIRNQMHWTEDLARALQPYVDQGSGEITGWWVLNAYGEVVSVGQTGSKSFIPAVTSEMDIFRDLELSGSAAVVLPTATSTPVPSPGPTVVPTAVP